MPKRKDHGFQWIGLVEGFVHHTGRFTYEVTKRASRSLAAASQGVKSGPATVVKVIDNSARNAKGHPLWFMRVDTGGAGKVNPHVNVSPRITGVPDPHTAISPGMLQASPKVAKTMSVLSKGATVIAVAIDTVRLGFSVHKDVKNGSTRNSVTTAATVAGGWGGGVGGGMAGATIGTGIFPGVGTIIGSIIGGVAGAIGGSMGAEAATDAIAEKKNYNIVEKTCKLCEKSFKIRKYQGEKDKEFCNDCYVELAVFEVDGNLLFVPNCTNVERIQEWETVLWPRLIAIICGERPMFVACCFPIMEGMQDVTDQNCLTETPGDGNVYTSAGPQSWSENYEMYEILLNDYGFVESDAWIYFSEKNVHKSPSILFNKVFYPLHSGEFQPNQADVECIGRVQNGLCLLWHKPDKSQLEIVKRKVEEVAAELNMYLITKYL